MTSILPNLYHRITSVQTAEKGVVAAVGPLNASPMTECLCVCAMEEEGSYYVAIGFVATVVVT